MRGGAFNTAWRLTVSAVVIGAYCLWGDQLASFIIALTQGFDAATPPGG